jgi:hypothetical protein
LWGSFTQSTHRNPYRNLLQGSGDLPGSPHPSALLHALGPERASSAKFWQVQVVEWPGHVEF